MLRIELGDLALELPVVSTDIHRRLIISHHCAAPIQV